MTGLSLQVNSLPLHLVQKSPVRGNSGNFEALGVGQLAEVRLLVLGSQLSLKFDTGIVKKWSLVSISVAAAP